MKNLLQIWILVLVFISSHLFGWEVTTHETITKIAVTGQNRVENFNNFIDTFNLQNEDYKDTGHTKIYYLLDNGDKLPLEGSFIEIVNDIANTSQTNQVLNLDPKIKNGTYVNLLQAGSVLEDTLMQASFTEARFNRHFYDPSEPECYGMNLAGVVSATCAKIWALAGDADPTMSYNLSKLDNEFSLQKVVGTSTKTGYLLQSIIGDTNSSRKEAQANLFVSLGFLSHLMEDMAQSSHVRNDAHGGKLVHKVTYADGTSSYEWGLGGDNEFEIWADENFNYKEKDSGSYSLTVNAPTYNPTSFDDLFTSTATWTNKNFFSDDTTPGDILDTHESPKNSTQQTEILTQYFGHNYYFLTASGLDIPDGTKLLYYIDRVGPKNLYTMVYDVPKDVEKLGYDKYSVLKDNAKLVFPKAVSAVEGMINYIFRGKIYAYLDPNDEDKLIIKNITNQNEVANGLDTAFRGDTKVYVYYETKSGERKALPTIGTKTFSELNKAQLSNDDTITITGLSSAIAQVSDEMSEDKTIIVALEGQMGGDDIGEKVIAGTKLVFKNNASILMSFDDSGSMGSEIEYAKQSALNILPLLEDNNNSLVEIQAFNSYGVSFTSDMDAVRSKINSLYSSGGTPLYESIVSAANSASGEKNKHPNNKVIVVLYTDGVGNNDYNKQNAINSISTVEHPEIDEVYLVFVNTGDLTGKQALEEVALRSNRKFIYLNSADQLATELQKVLQ